MKNNIDTYKNSIYEFDLVVASDKVSLEDIQKEYEYSSGDPIDNRLTGPYATATTVRRKSDGRVVCLIKLNSYDKSLKSKTEKHLWLINTIGHEALHYLLDLCYTISEIPNTECQEMFAYIQGWATECIYKTWMKKDDTNQKRRQTKG